LIWNSILAIFINISHFEIVKLWYPIFFLVFTLAISCSQTRKKDRPVIKLKSKGTGSLISINFADTNYNGVQDYAKDTITKSGWAIKYFIKDDSTRYDDLYIKWSKGSVIGTFYCGDALEMRRYFIPVLSGENKSHIFLEHGCSTGGEAVLILPKYNELKGRDYSYVIKYDITTSQIVYMPENSFNTDTPIFSVIDLHRNIEKQILFKNIYTPRPEDGCIDRVIFNKDFVKLYATLQDKNAPDKSVKESHIVRFGKPGR